jgi:outer membrane receptor protein involved in Fe transport
VAAAVGDLDIPQAAAFDLVGRQDIEERRPEHLSSVLENIPGTNGSETDHSAVPALRGMAQSRTLILLDEGRVSAERRAGASASYLDPMTVDEVEVVRGPGAVAYGSDAFGGVIRARTAIHSPGDPLTLRYDLGGATGVGEQAAAFDLGTSVGPGGLSLGASYRSYDDYRSPEGEVYNSAAEYEGARLGYQQGLLGGTMRCLWRTDLGRDVGKPAVDSLTSRTYYPEENSHRFSLGFDRPGPGSWSRLSVAASWDAYQLLTDRDRVATSTRPRDLSEADVDANDYGVRVEAERALGEGRLILGVDLNRRYDLSAVNTVTVFDAAGQPVSEATEVSIESAQRDDAGVFAGLNGRVGRFSLAGGLRGDHAQSENRGGYFGDRTTSSSSLSGFVSATLAVTGSVEVALQAARGFRDALLSDRYYRGISGRGFITGNPDLEPETSRQLDLAVRYGSGGLRLAAYGYLYRVRDLIERYKEGDNFYFRNRGEAELKGVELEGSAYLGAGFLLQGGLQLPSGEVLDDDTPTDAVPSRGGFILLRHEPSARWWWLARLGAYDRDERPGPTEQVVPGWAVLDGGVGVRVARALELRLYGRNLLDHAYLASADASSVLAPGRSVALTLHGQL